MRSLDSHLNNQESILNSVLGKMRPEDRSFIVNELKIVFNPYELMSVIQLSRFVFRLETFSGKYKLDLQNLSINKIR